ncbi:caspase-3-like [Mya arenaria]|uniref:caspase-3-like n=1 Tax=Mya arenaria TaxID=6604 RepID=UPI0022E15B22|nr:caspase-3-like [Mya arenaria]
MSLADEHSSMSFSPFDSEQHGSLGDHRASSTGDVSENNHEESTTGGMHGSKTVPCNLDDTTRETFTAGDDSDDDNAYTFNHHMRGHAIIVVNDTFQNYDYREGAKCDLRNMKEIAKQFGFKWQNRLFYENVTHKQMNMVLKDATNADHSKCDGLLFMISTHGEEKENPKAKGKKDHALICSDDRFIYTSEITKMFNDKNCPSLKGKPKFFFVQACRGKEVDEGVNISILGKESQDPPHDASSTMRQHSVDQPDAKGVHNLSKLLPSQCAATGKGQTETNETPTPVEGNKLSERSAKLLPYPIIETPSLKCENDQLVFYAIPPGYFAWRSEGEGSWMIYYLHALVMAHSDKRKLNLISLLTRVTARMSVKSTNVPGETEMDKKKAVPVIEHKLMKDVVFSPYLKES